VRIVTELIAQKDATAIAIMTQEAKEVKIYQIFCFKVEVNHILQQTKSKKSELSVISA